MLEAAGQSLYFQKAVMILSTVSCYSKKYLSQKNVVEKMNANVMQGKVRLLLDLQELISGRSCISCPGLAS